MRLRPRTLCLLLVLALAAIALVSPTFGSTDALSTQETWRGFLAHLGLGEPLAVHQQTIFELRFNRTLVTIAVGAALALSGGLMQGVFRNDLASPSLLGVSAGASLGASVAILLLGGYAPGLMEKASLSAPLFVCLAALAGALGVTALVAWIATSDGRLSVPTLLLVGIAMNAVTNGLLFALQALVLADFEVTRALISWSFGTLDNRTGLHAAMVFSGVAFAALLIPFVRMELDLFAAGESDAEALGVDTRLTKFLALGGASVAAAVAVAVAGNITFVGLVVPHLLRLACERSHRSLLPLCLLGGPVFLLGTDLVQRVFLGDLQLGPGVTMSLIGGPFFLFLLIQNRKAVQAW